MPITKEIKKSYNIKTLIPELNDNGIEKYCKNFLNIRNIKNVKKATGLGFAEPLCFDYAFDKMKDTDFFADFSLYDYLYENYRQIKISQAKKDDIITYHNDNGHELTHYAKIYKTNNTLRGTIIRSKWGSKGIYETDVYSVPTSYGNIIRIWRKRKNK